MPQKLGQIQTTQLNLGFLQIHLPKLNLYCITLGKKWETLVFWMQTEDSLCFKKQWAISTLSGKTLKWENQFKYHGSIISSTDSDVSKPMGKKWTAINCLSILWESDFSDKI